MVDIGSEDKEEISQSKISDKTLKKKDSKHKFIYWIQRGKVYIPSQEIQLVNKVTPGLYSIEYSDEIGIHLRRQEICSDDVIELPIEALDKIYDDIVKFWDRESSFLKYNLTYKRGILLHGQPGCGKTYVIKLITNYLIKKKQGLVFRIATGNDLEEFDEFVKTILREIEPNTPIVVTIEDIDGFVTGAKSNEQLLLNILDGITQTHNVVYIATTNYPEQLKDRITNRPSRFDRVYEIGLPTAIIRKVYIENVLHEEDLKIIDLKEWIKKSKGLTLAHLRELVVSVIIMGNPLDETIKLLNDLADAPDSSNYKTMTHFGKVAAGFGSTQENDDDDEDGFEKITWTSSKRIAKRFKGKKTTIKKVRWNAKNK